MEQGTRKYATYAGYFISGAVIGAVLGALYAPKAGKETREQMNAWLKDKREKGRVRLQAAKEALEKGRETFRDKTKELAGV